VRLTSGIDYKGVLTCLDGYMNIALEDCAEWVGGQRRGVYGDAFVRGNNGACGEGRDGGATRREVCAVAWHGRESAATVQWGEQQDCGSAGQGAGGGARLE
jgi:hypothetical protein